MPKGVKGSRAACKVIGCDGITTARGLCKGHYDRQRRTGEVGGKIAERRPAPDTGRCTRPDCEERHYAKGECKRHYYMSKRGKAEAELPKKGVYRYNAAGDRWCTGCKDYHEVSRFAKASNYSDGLQGSCRMARAWERRFERYGLTKEAFTRLLAAQGGVCAICGDDEPDQIDHDHSCCSSELRSTCGQCVRGILCRRCNTTLGHLERENWMDKAVTYIGGKKA